MLDGTECWATKETTCEYDKCSLNENVEMDMWYDFAREN